MAECLPAGSIGVIGSINGTTYIVVTNPSTNTINVVTLEDIANYINLAAAKASRVLLASGANTLTFTDVGTVNYGVNVVECFDLSGNAMAVGIGTKLTNSFVATVPAAGVMIYEIKLY